MIPILTTSEIRAAAGLVSGLGEPVPSPRLDEPTWKPLSERFRHDEEVLDEGVPEWLWPSLKKWLNEYFDRSGDGLYEVERRLHFPLYESWSVLLLSMESDPEVALEVVNLVLFQRERDRPASGSSAQMCAELEQMLQQSGSAWRVATEGTPHLERRVPQEVRNRYESVSGEARCGEHLRQAWSNMYGRSPNASVAYHHAVKAVEAAGRSVIIPDNTRATLGTMITAFKDKPEKWNVPLGLTPEEGRDALLEMMKGVWRGQHDRHGTDDNSQPISVGAPEAEAALHASITLVHLFNSGLVSKAT